MTVPNEISSVEYLGPAAGPFAVTFPVLDPAHLAVVIADPSTDAVTALASGVDYTATVDEVALTVPLAAGWVLGIRRVVPVIQPVNFRIQGTFSPRVHERAFDLAAMAAQQIGRDMAMVVTQAADANEQASAFARGAKFVVRTDLLGSIVVAPPPPIGTLDFESGNLTPTSRVGAYVLEPGGGGSVARSPDYAHNGAYSMKIVGDAGGVVSRMTRSLTMPGAGIVTFERWYHHSAMGGGTARVIFGLSVDKGTGTWQAVAAYDRIHNAIVAYNAGYAITDVCLGGLLVSGNWYRVVAALNCGTNTYDVTVYNAAGTQIAQVTGMTVPSNFAGTTTYSVIGNMDNSQVLYVDDIVDGV